MTRIHILGDYNPDYVTHRALDAALAQFPDHVEARWVATDAPDPGPSDGVWVAPGSPYRNGNAVLRTIARARDDGTPLLGTCGGFQHAALALAGLGLDRHAEIAPDATQPPFVAPIACRVDGETRTVTTVPGTRLAELLGTAPFDGMFFCGYAPTGIVGARVSAHAEGVGVVGLELPFARHPFLLATLFQPQMGALRGEPLSPLLAAFVDAAVASKAAAYA